MKCSDHNILGLNMSAANSSVSIKLLVFAFSFLKEIEKFGMRIIERKQIYLFSDLKKESVKMMGAGILSMTDFQIENATHNIVEMTLRVKLDHKNLKKQIKLKRIETILD